MSREGKDCSILLNKSGALCTKDNLFIYHTLSSNALSFYSMPLSDEDEDVLQVPYGKTGGTPTKVSTGSAFIRSTCPHYADSSVSKFIAMLYGAGTGGVVN